MLSRTISGLIIRSECKTSKKRVDSQPTHSCWPLDTLSDQVYFVGLGSPTSKVGSIRKIVDDRSNVTSDLEQLSIAKLGGLISQLLAEQKTISSSPPLPTVVAMGTKQF